MEKVLVSFLAACVIARATDEHKQDAVASKSTVSITTNKPVANSFTPVKCNIVDQAIRHQIIEQSECGEPKEILVPLKTCASYEQISPDLVWLKRCVGHCDYFLPDSKCLPTETITRQIPIRITNVYSDKEKCSIYEVEEHLSCGCCSVSEGTCIEPFVNPGQCSCSCPNDQVVSYTSSKIN